MTEWVPTILVLDDDQRFLKLCEMRLEAAGMKVLATDTWVEVANLLKDKPDLALLDLNLASMQGDFIARIVKQNNPDLQVFLFSSEDEHILEEKARKSGADGYMCKSIGMEEMVSKVRSTLNFTG